MKGINDEIIKELKYRLYLSDELEHKTDEKAEHIAEYIKELLEQTEMRLISSNVECQEEECKKCKEYENKKELDEIMFLRIRNKFLENKLKKEQGK